MGTRNAGDVYVVNPLTTKASAVATTSGGVTIISVNTTGGNQFFVNNYGSINVYVLGAIDGENFQASINVYRLNGGGAYSAVEAVSGSTVAMFEGPYQIVKVVANSGSGIYRVNLNYR